VRHRDDCSSPLKHPHGEGGGGGWSCHGALGAAQPSGPISRPREVSLAGNPGSGTFYGRPPGESGLGEVRKCRTGAEAAQSAVLGLPMSPGDHRPVGGSAAMWAQDHGALAQKAIGGVEGAARAAAESSILAGFGRSGDRDERGVARGRGGDLRMYWPIPDGDDPRPAMQGFDGARLSAWHYGLGLAQERPPGPSARGSPGDRAPPPTSADQGAAFRGTTLVPALLLVPHAPFDRAGRRLGYGAGLCTTARLGVVWRARAKPLPVGPRFRRGNEGARESACRLERGRRAYRRGGH